MKYIHGREIPGRAAGSAIVRIVFGGILAVAFIALIIGLLANPYGIVPSTIIAAFFTVGAGSALLLIFGIRALIKSLKPIPMRDPNKNEIIDPLNPFFTVSCPACATKFDYQRSDLGFRAWYPNGYVVCPSCGSNIRHNAQTNEYETFGQDVYIYPEN